MGTLKNCEDPNEMLQNAEFHQGKYFTCYPLNYINEQFIFIGMGNKKYLEKRYSAALKY